MSGSPPCIGSSRTSISSWTKSRRSPSNVGNDKFPLPVLYPSGFRHSTQLLVGWRPPLSQANTMALIPLKRERKKASPSVNRSSPHATHVVIIGAGHGGTALMEIFATDPLVRIVGVAE